jgi:biotin carboxyl carrier protein
MTESPKEKKEKVSFYVDGTEYKTWLPENYEKKRSYRRADEYVPTAFIPGTITKVYVKAGQKVRKGDKLVILEAMKMKNRVLAPLEGRVAEVLVNEGDRVTKGQALVFLEKKEEE